MQCFSSGILTESGGIWVAPGPRLLHVQEIRDLYCERCKDYRGAPVRVAEFAELHQAYPVCGACGKAQRRARFMKPATRRDQKEVEYARLLEAKARSQAERIKLRVLI